MNESCDNLARRASAPQSVKRQLTRFPKKMADRSKQLQLESGSKFGLTLSSAPRLIGCAAEPPRRMPDQQRLNAIDPSLTLIGTEFIHEPLDRGDSLNNLRFVGNVGVTPGLSGGHLLAYGARLNGVSNPDVF
jgi:hypothetical protein